MSKAKQVVTTSSLETIKATNGARRVTSELVAKQSIGRFTMNLNTSEVKQPLLEARACLEVLKSSDSIHTCFGHKAFNPSGCMAMTAVIDSWLLGAIVNGTFDVKQLINECFNTLTTTSRVTGESSKKQVLATYTKVVSHLGCFVLDSKYNRYLSKRLATKGYNASESRLIFNSLGSFAQVTREAIMNGKKAASKGIK